MRLLISVLFLLGLLTNIAAQDTKYNPKAVDLLNEGVLQQARFNYDSALIFFDQAIEIDQTYYLPHSNKVKIYLLKQEPELALKESKLVIKKKSDLAEGWFFTGLLVENLGDKEEARSYYLKSIELYLDRLKNPEKDKSINSNRLNLALAKKMYGDNTYSDDLEALESFEDYQFLVNMVRDNSRLEILNQLLN